MSISRISGQVGEVIRYDIRHGLCSLYSQASIRHAAANMELRESKQTGPVEDVRLMRQIETTITTLQISKPPVVTMPRVAQQPRAANGRNVSGSMAASPFKSPTKYENVVIASLQIQRH